MEPETIPNYLIPVDATDQRHTQQTHRHLLQEVWVLVPRQQRGTKCLWWLLLVGTKTR